MKGKVGMNGAAGEKQEAEKKDKGIYTGKLHELEQKGRAGFQRTCDSQ